MTHATVGRGASVRIALALVALVAVFFAQGMGAQVAFADSQGLSAMAVTLAPQTEASITGEGSATVTTDDEGDAFLKLVISEEGLYSITSTASTGVDGDTCGYLYLYDERLGDPLAESDDCHADTNFTLCQNLAAGTYYLRVTGKETQEAASITVKVAKGCALNTLDCICTYNGSAVSTFALGTWLQGDKTEWEAADASSYRVVGYVDRNVFIHAQESGAVAQLAWKTGLPQTRGRFAVMVEAVGNAYTGNAYYFLDEMTDPSSISELDPVVRTAVCGAIVSVELGKYTTVPTNWSTRWDAITASYYEVVGYCERGRFEMLGGDDSSIAWTKGYPCEEGSYVVKCAATTVEENPYTGSCYVWADVEETSHAASGAWVVDKKPTFDKPGSQHLSCLYCGAPCDYEEIPALKDTVVTAGSGATLADYKIVSADTVSYEKCLSAEQQVAVPDTVNIGGATYKVVNVAAGAFANMGAITSIKIGKNVTTIGKNACKGCGKLNSMTIGAGVKSIGATAFAKCKALKVLDVKTKKLTEAGMKNCLKKSSVTTAKVPKAKKQAYAAIFVKKICGKNVKVQ